MKEDPMIKVRILAMLAGIVLLLAIPTATWAQGVAPATWDGVATLDGEVVADGTIISALVGDTTSTAVVTEGIYFILVAQAPGEDFANADVQFMVGDAMAAEVGTWTDRGDNRDFALTAVTDVIEEPEPVLVEATEQEKGEQGAKGFKGDRGFQGFQGDPGPTGKGAKGDRGAPGNSGATGADGTNGTNGTNGANGSNGAGGVGGAQGPQGFAGENGGGGALGVIALILAIVALVGVGGTFAMSRKS
jgi:hypothetical protein